MAVRNKPVKSVSVSFQSQAGLFFLVLVEKSRKRTRRYSGFSCRKGHVLVLAHLPHKVTTDLMPRLHMALLYTLAGTRATERDASSLEVM